jgi:probable HAF family extracellular repeat protein
MIILLKRLSACFGLLAALACITAGSAFAAPPPGWTATDLLTLGGATTYPSAINEAGRVVGDSQTAAGDIHGFFWTQAGGIVNLPPLGGAYSTATAVNASGQAAGTSSTAAGPQHAVRWPAAGGAPTDITPTASDSYAVAINASGAVAGTLTTAAGLQRAFYWSGSGAALELGTLGGTYSIATGMNASGQVVGYSAIAGDLHEHAFLWTPGGTMVDVGGGSTDSRANAVNDAGQVVGWAAPNADQKQAFSWTQAGGRVLFGAASASTMANAVSANGHVVGTAGTAEDPMVQSAFSWTAAGGLVPIATLGGASGIANGVNATGEVVGSSTIVDDNAGHGFFWSATGGLIDLGTLDGTESFATAVSANGQVVGNATVASGEIHGVVWTRTNATPPVVTPTVTGTLGLNGWYTSNVTVSWTVTDPETPPVHSCTPTVVTADTTGMTVTCVATSTGGTTTQSVTVKRDATAPTVAFAAHPAGYSADQNIVFGCTASDATSGVLMLCQGVNVAASSLKLGANTRTTSASDNAGNVATATTTFTIVPVGVTPPTAIVNPNGTITPAPRSRTVVATALSPKLKAARNAVRVTLKAPAGATASGVIQLKAKLAGGKKAKLKNVGSKAFKLTAGQTKTFTVALSKGGKSRLASIGKLKVSVVIAAKNAAGKPKATTRAITLTAVK